MGISVVLIVVGVVVSDGVKECMYIDLMFEGVFLYVISWWMFILVIGGILVGVIGVGVFIGILYSLGGLIDFGWLEVFGKRKIILEIVGVFLE